ncbi:MAG: hypothetical protein LBJ04_01820 [Sphingobacterium sp.]|jgi:hypothetical protein|nr:hypothetical protein [Sphingobacterium sp.]
MINKLQTLILAILIFGYSGLKSQNLYFIVEKNNLVKNSPVQKKFVKDNNLKQAVVLYQDDFVTHNLNQDFSPKIMDEVMGDRFPTKSMSGIGLLDWEGKKAQILYGTTNASEKEFNTVLKEFISAIRYAKELRPNVKWSFYGFPVRVLKDNTYVQWQRKVERLEPLFREMDYICPNFYQFLRNDKDKYEEDVRQHVLLSIKIGQMVNKPVLGLVWHRYQTNSELVPPNEFASYVDKISSYSYQNKKLDGVIWWNSEGFNYIRKARYPKIAAEYKAVSNTDNYQYNNLKSYLGLLKRYYK